MIDAESADNLARAICNTFLFLLCGYTSRPCTVTCADCRAGAAAVLKALADQSEQLYCPTDGELPAVRVDHINTIVTKLERPRE
jgi:hypothetical protein